MKRYKLKKDLPTVRAGEVFMRKTNETMQADMLHRVDSEDVFLPPSIDVDDLVHEFRLSIGGLYPMSTPDDLIIKEQVLIPQAMHRLKMAAKKAWFEFNGSEGPDWNDEKQDKYVLGYDYRNKFIDIDCVQLYRFSSLPEFPTEASIKACISKEEDSIKLLFGVE